MPAAQVSDRHGTTAKLGCVCINAEPVNIAVAAMMIRGRSWRCLRAITPRHGNSLVLHHGTEGAHPLPHETTGSSPFIRSSIPGNVFTIHPPKNGPRRRKVTLPGTPPRNVKAGAALRVAAQVTLSGDVIENLNNPVCRSDDGVGLLLQ